MLVPYETFSIDFLDPLKLLTFNAFLIAQVKKNNFFIAVDSTVQSRRTKL